MMVLVAEGKWPGGASFTRTRSALRGRRSLGRLWWRHQSVGLLDPGTGLGSSRSVAGRQSSFQETVVARKAAAERLPGPSCCGGLGWTEPCRGGS